MLLQFNVTNIMSFKEEAILTLIADSDSSHEETLLKYRKERILPVVAIYGANAAGKSNLFKALTQAILFVRNSAAMQINAPISIVPFLMDEQGRKGKSRFDFIYVYGGIKYEYGFVADAFRVYEEYLYEYRSAKPTLIFERENVNEYHYTSALKRKLRPFEERNTDNKLFLATATQWNCKETENAYRWFAEMIDTYNHTSVEQSMADELDSDDKDKIREFAKKYLKAADLNIADYQFEVKQGLPKDIELPPGIIFDESILANMKQWELHMRHDVEVDGKIEPVFLPFQQESNGTQTYFAYCPAIYRALKTGKTVVIDEIDNNLHPLLVQHLVELFLDPIVNRNGAQLIFNTHEVELLDLDLLRRDQIYFVEKDNRTGASELYALSDFSPRKSDKIQKGYLLGRYGAVPNIGGGIEW